MRLIAGPTPRPFMKAKLQSRLNCLNSGFDEKGDRLHHDPVTHGCNLQGTMLRGSDLLDSVGSKAC